MIDTVNFTRGAFAIYEPDNTKDLARFIPFRFNPETLTRQLGFQQAQGSGSQASPGASSDAVASGEQGADAALGTLKETFSVLLRFDLAEREEARGSRARMIAEEILNQDLLDLGVLPELSALEDLMHPAESKAQEPSDGSEPVDARARMPLVLFLWGERRVIPVKITGMAIAETLFNSKLYPVRAEVEVSLEVLGEKEARDNTRVRASLGFTAANRRKMARIYLDTTANQGTNINLPQ